MELTDKQKEIVNYNQLGTLIVKGTAGSGKSLVGLHRINFLFDKKNNSLFSNNKKCKVLVITFNKVMFYHLKQMFEQIKNKNIPVEDVEFINIDKIMYRENVNFIKKNYKIIMDEYNTKMIIDELNINKKKYSTDFIFDEFKWIRHNLINREQDYLNVIRLGRGKRKLNKNDREYIWGILQKYRETMIAQKKIDYLDACILTLKKSNLNLFSNYNHIIVDEAQDLSKLKLSFITKLNENNLKEDENSLMILYDSSQNVYDESWLGYGRSFASIGLEVRNKIKKLETSYRTTRQIHQAANDLITAYKDQNVDVETEIKPLFIGSEEGIKPITFKFKNKDDEYNTYCNIIKKLTDKTYLYKDIIIVSFTNNSLKEFEEFSHKCGIPSYILDGNKIEQNKIKLTDNKIKLLTVNNAKGLESKIIFIINTDSLVLNTQNNEQDENERNVRNAKKLYTAMTRSQELLFISEDNEYIKKINEKYLTKIEENYENLDIDSYISADLKENEMLIENNTTNRFNNIISEYKKQIKENEEIYINNEIQIQKKLYSNYLIENEQKKLEIIFKELDAKIVELILEAEKLYDLFKKQSISASIVYIAYSKILEYIIRNFIEELKQEYDTKVTFGTLLGYSRKFTFLKPICKEIDSLKILDNRNCAAHSILKNSYEVEKIRTFLIENKGILKLSQAIKEQLSKKLVTEEKIIKEGILTGNYSLVKIKKKEYFSYLINNDDLAISETKIKLGNYQFIGHHINSRGMQIFVIDNFLKK